MVIIYQRDLSNVFEAGFSLSSVHLNNNEAALSTPLKRSNRHPVPKFTGSPDVSAVQWLNQFRKTALYHQFTEEEQLGGFRMAMVDAADTWWSNLVSSQRATIKNAIAAFETHLGGKTSEAMEMLEKLYNCKQGRQSMISFGPKLQVIMDKLMPNNDVMHLYFFHQKVPISSGRDG